MRCEIIKDLLPLYCDDALSDVSREEVERHITNCEQCKKTYEEMKNCDLKLEQPQKDIEPLKKVKKKISITKILLITVISTFLLIWAAYELLCAHPRLASYENISFSPTVTRVDVYRYFDDTELTSKEIQLPKNSECNIDTYNNVVYVNGEKLLDENNEPVPATGELYPVGSFRVYIHVDNKLTALKYRIDQSYTDGAVSAKIEFRPCLPFRQNMNEIANENGIMWSAPLRDITKDSKLVVHCRDRDIIINLYDLVQHAD